MPYPAQINPHTLGLRALEVAEACGWDGWTLRSVAAALGVTANALYRHIGDRAGLAVAMGEAATRELHKTLAADSTARGADEAVRELARRFVAFAVARPHAYAAFMRAKPPPDDPAVATWILLWDDVNACVRRAVPEAADAAAFALWALLHGRIELAAGPAYGSGADAGLDDAVNALLRGYRAISPVTSPLPALVRRDPGGHVRARGASGES
jgi:AcrR family transcriptional regulator